MEMNKKLNLGKINRRIDDLNKLESNEEKVAACKSLFVDVLNAGELYIIATPETTKEEWDNSKIRPYIANASQGELYYMRVFSDRKVAENAAKRVQSILSDGTIMVIKTTAEDLTALVRDYFILGIEGVLLNDGEQWITYNCEAFLYASYKEVLENPLGYDTSFINWVRAIHDIASNRVRIVAPVKYFESINKDDIFTGKAELFPFGDEVLLLEYYDKYKVEEIFKDKVFWLDLTIEKLYSLMDVAEKVGLKNIKIAYRGKEGNGAPQDIASLLGLIGVKKYRI